MSDLKSDPAPGPLTQPEPQTQVQPKPVVVPNQNGHKYSRQAGLVVCIMSTGFVFGIILLLFLQAWLQHKELGQLATTSPNTIPVDIYYSLEQETLRLRASRASIAQLYRHFVAISGLIVSMSMILLGAILIFDRVLSPEANTINGDLTGKGNFEFRSAFPGLMLCLMGAMTVALNLYFSGPKAASFVTRDIPAYLRDQNWSRNAAGFQPCFGMNTAQSASDADSCNLQSIGISAAVE